MRLIRSGALPPALNLALDEALLRSGEETLRFYAWDPPGFSLGFFQKAGEFTCPTGFELVRRPTGGGAIAHTGELTITWVGQRRRVDEAYLIVNRIVMQALRRIGIETHLGDGEPQAAPAGLCFDAHTRYDVLAPGGGKIFGSAQRRGGNRFLLHGTLVLEPNAHARGATSVAEAAGRAVPFQEMEAHLVAVAPFELTAAMPSPEEWQHADRLVLERYGNERWTRRR